MFIFVYFINKPARVLVPKTLKFTFFRIEHNLVIKGILFTTVGLPLIFLEKGIVCLKHRHDIIKHFL